MTTKQTLLLSTLALAALVGSFMTGYHYALRPSSDKHAKHLTKEAASNVRKGHQISINNAEKAKTIEPRAKAREAAIDSAFKSDSTIFVSMPRQKRDSVVLRMLNLGLQREAE